VTTLLRICGVFHVPVARLLQGLDKGIYDVGRSSKSSACYPLWINSEVVGFQSQNTTWDGRVFKRYPPPLDGIILASHA
jgi:hypothetical protein